MTDVATLSVREAAHVLGVNYRTLLDHVDGFGVIRVGKSYRIPRSVVEDMVSGLTPIPQVPSNPKLTVLLEVMQHEIAKTHAQMDRLEELMAQLLGEMA